MTDRDSHQLALAKTAVATATAQPENQTGEMGLPDQFGDIGSRVVNVLRAAEESAQKILATVQNEALAIKQQADTMLRQVKDETSTLREEAARLVSEAREEADAVVAQARQEADQIRKDSLTEASRLHDAARRIHAQLNAANDSVSQSLEILPSLIGEIEAPSDEAEPGGEADLDLGVPGDTPQVEASADEPS
jgi:dsDNA-specific endonuclease/ATPase MutS2